MTYLLDSHTFLWLATTHDRVPDSVKAELLRPDAELAVSAVSAFELATKQRIGKFSSPILERWDEAAHDLRAWHLSISPTHALLAGRIAWDHRDPFDRLLAAQTISDGLTLVTADRAFDTAPGVSLLRW